MIYSWSMNELYAPFFPSAPSSMGKDSWRVHIWGAMTITKSGNTNVLCEWEGNETCSLSNVNRLGWWPSKKKKQYERRLFTFGQWTFNICHGLKSTKRYISQIVPLMQFNLAFEIFSYFFSFTLPLYRLCKAFVLRFGSHILMCAHIHQFRRATMLAIEPAHAHHDFVPLHHIKNELWKWIV